MEPEALGPLPLVAASLVPRTYRQDHSAQAQSHAVERTAVRGPYTNYAPSLRARLVRSGACFT
ncbi:hypothetical protein Slala02_42770 [Streptomyces lavendulae subsp. lavendulae]|nr:hypothetical protein Slala02_42770 [Streptomyces lavendulae subsp. lavendulae]